MPKDVGNIWKHEIDYIIKHNKLLADHAIKMRLLNYCPSIGTEAIFMNTGSKTNEPHKSIFNLSQKLNLRSSNASFQNFYFSSTSVSPFIVSSIYYMCQNKRQPYENNKLKTIAPT